MHRPRLNGISEHSARQCYGAWVRWLAWKLSVRRSSLENQQTMVGKVLQSLGSHPRGSKCSVMILMDSSRVLWKRVRTIKTWSEIIRCHGEFIDRAGSLIRSDISGSLVIGLHYKVINQRL